MTLLCEVKGIVAVPRVKGIRFGRNAKGPCETRPFLPVFVRFVRVPKNGNRDSQLKIGGGAKRGDVVQGCSPHR